MFVLSRSLLCNTSSSEPLGRRDAAAPGGGGRIDTAIGQLCTSTTAFSVCAFCTLVWKAGGGSQRWRRCTWINQWINQRSKYRRAGRRHLHDVNCKVPGHCMTWSPDGPACCDGRMRPTNTCGGRCGWPAALTLKQFLQQACRHSAATSGGASKQLFMENTMRVLSATLMASHACHVRTAARVWHAGTTGHGAWCRAVVWTFSRPHGPVHRRLALARVGHRGWVADHPFVHLATSRNHPPANWFSKSARLHFSTPPSRCYARDVLRVGTQ